MAYQLGTTKLILPVLFLLIVAGCLDKSHLPQPHSGPFDGEVIDSLTEEAIPGVTLEVGGQVLVTDSAGRFYLSNLAPGDYQVTLSREWYQTSTGTLSYVGRPGEVTFKMQPERLSGSIWYSSDQPGKRDIFRLVLASRELEQLVLPNSNESNPVVLPDDSVIFQSDQNPGNHYDLFSSAWGSGKAVPLYSDPEDDQHPTVKKNGVNKWLVFQSLRDGHRVIFLYDLNVLNNTGPPREIARGQNPVLDPAGERVAYIDGSYRLNILTLNGANQVVVYPGAAVKCNNPCWSPDGSRIAVEVWNDAAGRHSIYIYNRELGSWQQVTFNNGSKDQGHRHPCWSSDGELLFFGATILYSSRVDIYCIRLQDATSQGAAAKWVMVSKGPGNKDYPSWGE